MKGRLAKTARSWARHVARSWWILVCGLGLAAEPPLDFLFPAGGQQGTRFSLVAGGRFESWPVSAWTDDPSLVFRPGRTNGQFEVDIASTVATGPHLVRLFNEQGASAPAQFVVGDLPELVVPSAGTNVQSVFGASQFPVTINGIMRTPHEAQTVRLVLPGACVVRARLCAIGLDSPLRGTLELLDAASNRLAFVEPPAGREPELSQPVLNGGDYWLRTAPSTNAHVSLPGNAVDYGAVYRLTVQTEPPPPLPAITSFTARPVRPDVVIWHPARRVRPLAVPSVSRGFIEPHGSEANYAFTAHGQERFCFRLRCASIGSTLVPTVQILDSERNVLAQAAPGGDVELRWTAPTAGEYILAVLGQLGHGGAQVTFQLEVDAPQPFFRVAVARQAYTLKPGETNSMTLAVVRSPTSSALLQVAAQGLPPGLAPLLQVVPAGATNVDLALVAASNARPASQPFWLSVLNVGQMPPQTDLARVELRGRYAPPGGLLINETDQLWVTVLPQPPLPAKP
jgi:hypothetical protein